MLTGLDLFQLARHLEQPIEDIIEQYTVPVPLSQYNFPLLTLKTKQYGDVCVFYKAGACTTQSAKPLVCRLYPLNIAPSGTDGLEYYMVSQKPHHYTGTTCQVSVWMEANLTANDRRYMVDWYKMALAFGKVMRKIQSAADKEKQINLLCTHIVWFLYFHFNTMEDFWPQYQRNMQVLQQELDAVVAML